MKRTLAMLLAVLMMGGLVACGAEETPAPADPAPAVSDTEATEPAPVEKQVINLWSFTDEVPKMVRYYISQNPEFAEKYEIKETIIATDGGGYQTALDQALAAGGEDAPDMYCAEAAFILKYAQGDAAKYAAAYEDLGIDVAAKMKEADIAQYSADIATYNGKVVGLGYQATGGAFIYRASIAEEVFGASDAATVEAAIGAGTQSWDKFWEAAAQLKAAGYPIVSGDGDIWHAVENSSEKGWIVDGALNIDPNREAFFEISKKLNDNGWTNKTTDWTDAWYADMGGTSETPCFGFFGPAWLLNYTMAGHAEAGNSWGDWRVCTSPVGFFWGGT
ncbi:MAG: extracellular solute-binding protein, partial [Ruminococcaceae bacterium]|nr:extracellular solute-binding protein [Oscillospiraceae bacterium]